MKKIFAFFIIISSFFYSCSNTPAKADTEYSFIIEGMTCQEMCAKTIQEDILKMDGVTLSTVNFESKKAVIKFDSKIISFDKISDFITHTQEGKYSISEVSHKNLTESYSSSSLPSSTDNERGFFQINSFESFSFLELVSTIF